MSLSTIQINNLLIDFMLFRLQGIAQSECYVLARGA